jgi:hypothetical protein
MGFGGLNFVGLALLGKDIVFRFIIKYTLVPLANLILIILFLEMSKISKNVSSKSKNIVKENSEYLRIFHFLK